MLLDSHFNQTTNRSTKDHLKTIHTYFYETPHEDITFLI